jgi:transcriptional regulator with XRE-family HTH domain
MPSLKKIFSQRLKTVRETKGYSQTELARKVGLQRSSVSKMEAYESPNLPSLEVLVSLSKELSVSADYLLGISESVSANVSEKRPPIPDWLKPLLPALVRLDPVRIEIVSDIIEGSIKRPDTV